MPAPDQFRRIDVDDDAKFGSVDADTASTNLASATVTYVVYKDSDGNIIARNRDDATEEFSGTEPGAVIQDVVDNGLPDNDPGRAGRVHFTNDRYFFDTSVELGEKEVSFTGENPTRTKLVQNADMDGIFTLTPTNAANHFAQFIDLKFNGQKDQNTKGSAVYATNAQDLHFIRCYAKKFTGDGIYADQVRGWRVRDSYIEQCAGHGIQVTGGKQGHFVDNRLGNNTGDGMVLNAADCTVRGNELQGNTNGIQTNANENRIIGNQINGNGSRGVYVRGSARYTKVIGNKIDGESTTQYGVHIKNTIGTEIEANTIQNHTGADIEDGGVRTVADGLGYNGANDPASAGDWYNNGYEGVRVKWDDGAGTHYISEYANGAWWDSQVS